MGQLGSKAPSFYYILNAVIFFMARVRIKGRPIYFILYKRITRFSCEYSVILTVLWNFNMHICIFSVRSRFTIYHYISMHMHIFMYTCFRCARNLYYANRFCRVLSRSKCYSSKTCLMCIICTLEYVRYSNGNMNNTSTLILWYRLLTDLGALMNL